MSDMFRMRGLAALAGICAVGVFALSGCSNFKQIVGLQPTMPDEFQVESSAPLTIPPDFRLRPPKPGAARPQDVAADKLARRDLDAAGPGKTDKGDADIGMPPALAIANAQAPNPQSEVAPGSLSQKLLDQGAGGATVEARATKPLQGVH